MPDLQTTEDKPPYLSLTTLLNFLDRWGEGAIPPRIDKSALDNYSGGTQSTLMSALRQIGYVDADDQVLPALREAITNVDASNQGSTRATAPTSCRSPSRRTTRSRPAGRMATSSGR